MSTPPPDLHDVAAALRGAGLSVVAVVPALDEATTVASVVTALGTLVDTAVLTEVVVVDGGSSDDTARLAATAGARVVVQGGPALGDLPPGRGKGDAMWQGVRATDADVVVFVDADVRGLVPHFVVPLLLPFLDDEVLLTKATYDRPLGTTGAATGGGRVTELLARPLLSVLWPELTFLAQPLAGEYAGRRSLLESLPFVQGYGVELGLLIDTVERHGPAAIAQVDLGVRHHSHQPLDALGRMAAELLAVGLDRADRYGRRPVVDPVLRQPVRTPDGALHSTAHAVTVRERPPSTG